MQPHDPSGIKLPYEQVVEMVADAGYAGMALDFGATSVADVKRIQPMMAKDFGAPFVVVIGQVMPLTVAGMIPMVRAWIEMSEKEGMPILFETHRDCITNDLFSTLCLLDAVPEMRLCADLSHYVIGREMACQLRPRDAEHMSRILARSDSFQGRVAGRGQIQLQLDFPQNQKWVDQFKAWWREGFTSWEARNDSGNCVFLCELGPPDYAITGPNGKEMSNRWNEALQIKGWVESIWTDTSASHFDGIYQPVSTP